MKGIGSSADSHEKLIHKFFITAIETKPYKQPDTMSVQPDTFNVSHLTGSEPVKHTGKDEYTTIPIKYGGNRLRVLIPYPGVFCNAIGESPKNPHKLTQGFSLETPQMVKMHEDATKALFELVVKYRDHPNMPKFCKNFRSVDAIMQAKKFGTTVKGLIHRPEKRDGNGQSTGEEDPDATPKCYVSLMRSSANHPETPSKIWTRYYSAKLLDPAIDAQIKSGILKEESFSFNPLDLLKRKTAMKAMPCYDVSDIYIADGNIVIRCAMSEVYIVKFETQESPARKELRSQVAKAGVTIDGPGELPKPMNSDDRKKKRDVEDMPMGDPEDPDADFVVEVTE